MNRWMASTVAGGWIAAWCLFWSALPLSAQLPPASASALGGLGGAPALARGFEATATNPAGLAMPRAPGPSWTALPLDLGGVLGPVGFGDFARYDGRTIPEPVRNAWLDRIRADGEQRGGGALRLTLASAAFGRLGVQLSTEAAGALALSPDAAELLLFGNERNGEPGEFRLAGSNLNGYVVTTLAVAYASPVGLRLGSGLGQAAAVGATLRYTAGNALLIGRDLGTFVGGDPFEARLRFLVIETARRRVLPGNGGGAGVDLGVQWEGGPWALGVSVRNVVSHFSWDVDDLVYRPGTGLFDAETTSSDFEPRPARGAPAPLLREVASFRFPPVLAAGLAHLTGRFTFHGGLDARLARGTVPAGNRFTLSTGTEYRPAESVALRAQISASRAGLGYGGGAGLVRGAVQLSGSLSHVRGGRDQWTRATLALSVEGG